MRAEKERATAATMAPTNNQLSESYQKPALQSTAKLQIGEFLLYLCARGRRSGSVWRHLEAELREVCHE